ncbi:rod shape-determining protein MreD [Streptococcus sp. H31]|uniref:rod shape-determining protein MreD n=1 Tax=Streptococcus huangxiaojuni TaxID=3237239 RepID=UPI0034A3B735
MISWVKNKYCLVFLIFILLLVDGQFSYLLNSLFNYYVIISSQLFLAALLFTCHNNSSAFIFFESTVIGLLFDFYYLNHIGVVTLVLPFLTFFIGKLDSRQMTGFFSNLVIYLIFIFFFNILSYFLSFLYGFTDVSLSFFITYNLAPTLVFNILVFFVCQKPLRKLFLD